MSSLGLLSLVLKEANLTKNMAYYRMGFYLIIEFRG